MFGSWAGSLVMTVTMMKCLRCVWSDSSKQYFTLLLCILLFQYDPAQGTLFCSCRPSSPASSPPPSTPSWAPPSSSAPTSVQSSSGRGTTTPRGLTTATPDSPASSRRPLAGQVGLGATRRLLCSGFGQPQQSCSYYWTRERSLYFLFLSL